MKESSPYNICLRKCVLLCIIHSLPVHKTFTVMMQDWPFSESPGLRTSWRIQMWFCTFDKTKLYFNVVQKVKPCKKKCIWNNFKTVVYTFFSNIAQTLLSGFGQKNICLLLWQHRGLRKWSLSVEEWWLLKIVQKHWKRARFSCAKVFSEQEWGVSQRIGCHSLIIKLL